MSTEIVEASSLRRVARATGDLLMAVGLVFCIPFVILAIGIPVALLLRGLLWIAGKF